MEPVSRRERHKQATRERILDCAAQLFAASGYDATAIDDIASCADVARATVFNYFARKEEIILEWITQRRARAAEVLATSDTTPIDTATRLGHAMRELAADYEADPVVGRAMVQAWLRAGGPLLGDGWATADLFATTIQRGQDDGDIAAAVDATVAGELLLDAYLGTLYRWAQRTSTTPLGDALQATLDLALTGMTTKTQNGGRNDEHPVRD
ncbi:MAG TPA: TetR/AcrR family transcriptional regulator [Acidimicrobiales bacterium]